MNAAEGGNVRRQSPARKGGRGQTPGREAGGPGAGRASPGPPARRGTTQLPAVSGRPIASLAWERATATDSART